MNGDSGSFSTPGAQSPAAVFVSLPADGGEAWSGGIWRWPWMDVTPILARGVAFLLGIEVSGAESWSLRKTHRPALTSP